VSVELIAGGKQVRVSVYGCPPEDALELLKAFVQVGRQPGGPELQAARARFEEARRKYQIMVRLLSAAPPGAISREDVIRAREDLRNCQRQLEGAPLVQKPQLVKPR
jgi:hypothetical protein